MRIPPDGAQRIRKALWNLTTLAQLHVVIGQLQQETETLLAPFDEPNDTDPGSTDPVPFKPQE